MTPRKKVPQLPSLLRRKIYKTGQTRGADYDVIYQNRVSRSSTVLIPYLLPDDQWTPPEDEGEFENGFIVLIPPLTYFGTPSIEAELEKRGLALGTNALVFYETRAEWQAHNPGELGWQPADSRTAPLGGQYVARVAGTTAIEGGDRINRGYNTSQSRGAGIRLYEYASRETIKHSRIQLEALFWLCRDALEVMVESGMSTDNAERRREHSFATAETAGLLDLKRLRSQRIVNDDGATICPLCLEELSAAGFVSRLAQPEGRHVHDLTVTEVNLFHVEELRFGAYNHRPYNLGWGHHHCNVVVRDAGIMDTIRWMQDLLSRNREAGHLPGPGDDSNKGS